MAVLATLDVPPTFTLLGVMFLGVVLVSLVLLRLRQSLLVGYFLCGVVIANSGILIAIQGPEAGRAVQQMSEYGVMLLLFVLGMEFSLGELRHLRRYAFTGGGLQMGLTVALAALVLGAAFRLPPAHLVVLAVACALSSTAISVKLFQDRGIAASPGARLALGVAIFQDLFVIGFLVFLPLLLAAGAGPGVLAPQLGLVVLKGLIFVGLAMVLAKWVIPRLLHAVARTRSRELFTLTVAGLCVGVALLAALLGLSLVLGAFVAGLAVSESIYKHRILADVAPLKDLFLTLFFVSVGLSVDLAVVLDRWSLVAAVTLGLIAGKAVLVGLVACWLGLAWRAAALAAAGLGSAGEFSLVLMGKMGAMAGWPDGLGQVFTAAMALSMALVPVLMQHAEPVGAWLERHLVKVRRTPVEDLPPAKRVRDLQDHAVVCGFGPVGRALVASLAKEGVSSLVIDLNADTIRELQQMGEPAIFADVRHPEAWDLCRLGQARLVAFTFPSSEAARAALPLVRERNASVAVIARTKFSRDGSLLLAAGANEIVHDEEESGRAVVRQALAIFNRGEPEV